VVPRAGRRERAGARFRGNLENRPGVPPLLEDRLFGAGRARDHRDSLPRTGRRRLQGTNALRALRGAARATRTPARS